MNESRLPLTAAHAKAVSGTSRRPATSRLLQRLRADIITCADNTYLGSENDLLGRYGVSRPTLRQAIGILEQESFLRVRRGKGGGFFTHRPTCEDAAIAAVQFIRYEGISFREMLDAWKMVRIEAARLAACNRQSPGLGKFSSYIERIERIPDGDISPSRFAGEIHDFNQIVSEIADNRFIRLFLEIFHENSKVIEGEKIFIQPRTRLSAYRRQMIITGHGIIEGDPDKAVLGASRCCQLINEWAMDIPL